MLNARVAALLAGTLLACAPAVPGQPTGVTATPQNNGSSIKISWSSVPGASSYSVFRSDTAGGEKLHSNQFDTTDVSFTEGALQSGKTYYYKVAAKGDGGY